MATKHHVEMRSLWRLARLCGVTPSYENVRGERVRATPEAVLHAVRSYGIDVQSPADAASALRHAAAERNRRFLEPVNVLWRRGSGSAAQGATVLTLQLMREIADRWCECRLVREDGEEHAWQVDLADIPAVRESGGRLHKPLGLPGPLPVGYHRLEAMIDKNTFHSWVFVAPQRAFQIEKRCWGAFMPLYALRSERNWGAGDLTDLRDLTQLIGERGGALLGTLPLLASSLHVDESDPSPYTPTSRLFWNEMYVDVEAAPEYAQCAEARAMAEANEYRGAIAELRNALLVEYGSICAMKRRVLEAMARQFFEHASAERRAACNREAKRDPLLDDFAQFLSTGEKIGRRWTQWPAEARDGRLSVDDYDERVRQYHVYAQSLCVEQLSRAARDADEGGCGLYLDLPVGVHPEGFDAWHFRHVFVHDASAGAPPDEFFTHGQNWGILPLHPQRTREDGHAYFRQAIARHLRFARALRIDHVMWMHRMYWAPHGMPASEGVYVRYPADELHAVLCIESQRAGVPIIGENLGTVPLAVDRAMDRHGIHPLYVAQFAWTGDAKGPLAKPRRNAIASLNTHDTPTFAEHWIGGDIARRADLGLLSKEEAAAEERGREKVKESVLDFVRHHRVRLRAAGESDEDTVAIATALLVELARSGVAVALVSLEDMWAERRPQNVPGTDGGVNWRRKASRTLDDIRSDHLVITAFEKLREVMT